MFNLTFKVFKILKVFFIKDNPFKTTTIHLILIKFALSIKSGY